MNKKDVELTPQPAGPGKVKWKVKHGGNSGEDDASYPHVTLPANSGPHLIVFDIPKANPNITFDKNDPIWVKENGKPLSKIDHPQIAATFVSNDGKQLVVLDRNDNDAAQPPLALYYQLNFNGTADKLDPIIDNGGTIHPPPPPPTTSPLGTVGGGLDIACLLIGLVIGLLIAFAWLKLRPSAK